MGDINKRGFETYFKKVVHNFDETKIWFEHARKMYEPTMVCFVVDGRLRKLEVYKDKHSIDEWAPHLVEFLATGKFDNNAYWQLYSDKDIDPADIGKVYAFPMKERRKYEFYPNSKELFNFLAEYREKWPNCGIKQVPKPIDQQS